MKPSRNNSSRRSLVHQPISSSFNRFCLNLRRCKSYFWDSDSFEDAESCCQTESPHCSRPCSRNWFSCILPEYSSVAKQQPKQFISRGTLTSIDLHETSLDPQIAPENAYTLSGPGISQTREPVRTGTGPRVTIGGPSVTAGPCLPSGGHKSRVWPQNSPVASTAPRPGGPVGSRPVQRPRVLTSVVLLESRGPDRLILILTLITICYGSRASGRGRPGSSGRAWSDVRPGPASCSPPSASETRPSPSPHGAFTWTQSPGCAHAEGRGETELPPAPTRPMSRPQGEGEGEGRHLVGGERPSLPHDPEQGGDLCPSLHDSHREPGTPVPFALTSPSGSGSHFTQDGPTFTALPFQRGLAGGQAAGSSLGEDDSILGAASGEDGDLGEDPSAGQCGPVEGGVPSYPPVEGSSAHSGRGEAGWRMEPWDEEPEAESSVSSSPRPSRPAAEQADAAAPCEAQGISTEMSGSERGGGLVPESQLPGLRGLAAAEGWSGAFNTSLWVFQHFQDLPRELRRPHPGLLLFQARMEQGPEGAVQGPGRIGPASPSRSRPPRVAPPPHLEMQAEEKALLELLTSQASPPASVPDSQLVSVPPTDREYWATFYFGGGVEAARRLLRERGLKAAGPRWGSPN
ncbi:collagen alpha-1(II) chain-like isoform X2 [Leucoraja erinacea]|nr:collagen alpha-1(II) chain-like isoform X2 [Leucoraja erinacea]